MQAEQLKDLVISALEELKGIDIKALDVKEQTTITDWMVIASGSSDRHVKSLADSVISQAKEQKVQPLGIEGAETGEWVLVDLGDVIAHIMHPETRDFYNLEKLWTMTEQLREKEA